MNKHTDFIQSPISEILRNAVDACEGIGRGIETYPILEYLMQSVFLRMTGFQEQKLKCICWDLATNDYEYRYDFLSSNYGECSNYKDKRAVYKDLIEQIRKYASLNLSTDIDKAGILSTTKSELKNIFEYSNLSISSQKSFEEYESIIAVYQVGHFANDDNNLFTDTPPASAVYSLKKVFEDHLYRHRNRCAHNTLSYQQNLPTLKTMLDKNYKYHNYFVWFAVLVLTDKIFVALYERYLHVVKENYFQ